MSTAIAAEGLSKKYLIAHQRESYVARDVLASKFKRLVGRSAERSAQENLWALRDVNFRDTTGRAWSPLIGRNGAGKSTLLETLSLHYENPGQRTG